jgi:hypothetical protein
MKHCQLIRPDGTRYSQHGFNVPTTYWGWGGRAEISAWLAAAQEEFGYTAIHLRQEPHRKRAILLVRDKMGLWKPTHVVYPYGEGTTASAMQQLLHGTGWEVVECEPWGEEPDDLEGTPAGDLQRAIEEG